MLHRLGDFKARAMGATYRSCCKDLAYIFGLYIIYGSLPLFPYLLLLLKSL